MAGLMSAPARGVDASPSPDSGRVAALPGTTTKTFERLMVDGRPERLSISLRENMNVLQGHVTYHKGPDILFEAQVEVSVSGIAVEAQSMGHEIRHRLEVLGGGMYRASWLLDNAVSAGLSWTGPEIREEDREDLLRYRAAVEASGAVFPAEEIEALLASVSSDRETPADILLRIALFAVDGQAHPMGPIGDYLDCLHESCDECRGCWDPPNGPCHGCPRDSWGAQLGSFLCYQLGAEVCWFRLLSPIKVPGTGK